MKTPIQSVKALRNMGCTGRSKLQMTLKRTTVCSVIFYLIGKETKRVCRIRKICKYYPIEERLAMSNWTTIIFLTLTSLIIVSNTLASKESRANKVSFFIWKINQRTFLYVLLAFQALALTSLLVTTLS
jgi:cellulose synthase/poly-beta-1,6-N-acetylglucosamine synthase-like glycosyltransferase